MIIVLNSFHLNGLILRFQTNYLKQIVPNQFRNRSGYGYALQTGMQSAFYV